MKKIVTVEQMHAIEQAADASGLSYEDMMENAGRAVAGAILERFPDLEGLRIAILSGPGNNGGDGLVAAYHLAEAGATVSVYLFGERGDKDENLARLKGTDMLIAEASQDQRWRVLKNMVGSSDILIDALLGTGTRLPLKGDLKKGLERVLTVIEEREGEPYVVAVDCPSGLDCDSGEIAEEALRADLTVTLAAAKTGLLRFPGAESVGEIVVADIGMSDTLAELAEIELEMATDQELRDWLPERPASAHKGTFGRLIVNAGSINYPGAAVLAGAAAYRVGAGLVTMGVPASIMGMVVGQLVEATWLVLPHEMGVINQAAWDVLSKELDETDALLIGPGFGREQVTRSYLESLFGRVPAGKRATIGFLGSSRSPSDEDEDDRGGAALPPCVIDADGLNLLSEIENWPQRLPKDTILTPHPGEMSRLTGESVEDIQADRVGAARSWAAEWGQFVLLKGAFSVVAAPDGRAVVIPFATPALARAGTGDVLAGAVAGLRAQGVGAFKAAILGAYLHARAGEIAGEYAGSTASVLAGDVSLALSEALAEIEFG